MGNELSRSTACKVWIKDVTEGVFSKPESRWEPGHVLTPRAESVSRVRLLGTVVSRFVGEDQKYASLTLDDGSDTITVRAFRDDVELLVNVKPGEIVDVIGRVKEYEDEKYISVEAVWRLQDPNWELVRRLELLLKGQKKEEAKTTQVMKEAQGPVEPKGVEEEVVGEDPKIVLLNLIEELDDGSGVKYLTLLKESGLEEDVLEGALAELMSDGDVYEPKIGRFKRV